MRLYLKTHIYDGLLCILICIGFIYNVLSGFLFDDISYQLPILIILSIALTCLYIILFYNKQTIFFGMILAIISLLGLILISWNTNILSTDKDNMIKIFYSVIVILTLVIYLVSLNKISLMIFFLLGNIIHAATSFLEYPCSIWAYLLFLLSTAMMLFYRIYKRNILKSHRGTIHMRGHMIQNSVVCIVSLLLSIIIFIGIIQPLNPPTEDLKLIQRLMSFEILEKVGISSIIVQPDENKTNQDINDELNTNQQEDTDEENSNGNSPLGQQMLGNVQDSVANVIEYAQAITYKALSYWYLWCILIIALIVTFIYSRQLLRKKWLNDIEKLTKEETIINLYSLFMLGIKKNGFI
ncbi:MAG: hypothetical protein LUG12_09045 [Erysipelotrichaceae bacterium]|nr:hypothetical protein [Erysipelotrichaceae bacterium]